MPFNFNKLWLLVSAKSMTKDELRNKIGASQTTIVKLGRNENVSLDVIDRICETLNCTPDDIYDYIPTSTPVVQQQIHLTKGDIFLANIYIDGSDSNKQRPVLIYQSNKSLRFSQSIMIIPLTAKLPKHDRLDIIDIPPVPDNHYMQNGAAIDISKLTSIRRINLVQKIGTLPNSSINRVDLAFSEMFDINKFL
jgi:Predicted transcriptional regulator